LGVVRVSGGDGVLLPPLKPPARACKATALSAIRAGGSDVLLPRPTHKGALALLAAARASDGDVLLLPLPTTRGGEAGTLSASVASGGDLRPQLPRPMSTALLDAFTYETIEEREVELKQQNNNVGNRPHRRGNTQRAVGVLEAGEQWQAQP